MYGYKIKRYTGEMLDSVFSEKFRDYYSVFDWGDTQGKKN